MREIIERVARAVCRAGFRNLTHSESIQSVDAIWGDCASEARAAIAEMRDLPDDYYLALVRSLNCRPDNLHVEAVRNVHRMFIDAILKNEGAA